MVSHGKAIEQLSNNFSPIEARSGEETGCPSVVSLLSGSNWQEVVKKEIERIAVWSLFTDLLLKLGPEKCQSMNAIK